VEHQHSIGGHGGRRRSSRSHHHGPWDHHGQPALRDLARALRGRASIRRGDVRGAILGALRDGPMHGYQVIQELEARSGGRWRPSAGSVYPTLQQLEDEGLVQSADVEGRRTYSLTEDGETAAAEAPELPWEAAEGGDDDADLRRLATQLIAAAVQVEGVGSAATVEKARRILVDGRRAMYRLLADEDGGES